MFLFSLPLSHVTELYCHFPGGGGGGGGYSPNKVDGGVPLKWDFFATKKIPKHGVWFCRKIPKHGV